MNGQEPGFPVRLIGEVFGLGSFPEASHRSAALSRASFFLPFFLVFSSPRRLGDGTYYLGQPARFHFDGHSHTQLTCTNPTEVMCSESAEDMEDKGGGGALER